jgi:DNA-binding transcriptional LysR family regulator
MRDLRDGRLDALIAPSAFTSPELNRVELGSEPWVVLVGPGHRLARPGPVTAEELEGEALVVTGHRDGAGYDRAVTATLTELGLDPALCRGGAGPALFRPVAGGEAVGLSTAAGGATAGFVVRPLRPARDVRFELQWHEDTPAPALREFIRAAESCAATVSQQSKPHLVAVA